MKRLTQLVLAIMAVGCLVFVNTTNAAILAQADFGITEGTDVSPFSTDYIPFPPGSPTPGHYGVAKSGAGNNWSSFDWGGLDHTNPGTGCFMVVDGSSNSNMIVLSYTTNTVAGSAYTLNGWAQTVQSNNGPDVVLSFRVNGVEVDTFTFSGNNEWVWHPFTLSYTTAFSGPTAFSLHDNTTSWGMNDFGLDDLVLSGPIAPIPEPTTILLLGSGLLGGGSLFRRRLKK